jgi:hypothetical protein
VPDADFTARARTAWENSRRADDPGYRYPARYTSEAAATQPRPDPEPEPEPGPEAEPRPKDTAMNDDYYRYPSGSPQHYAAYEQAFNAGETAATGNPDIDTDPRASYYIDNAWELGYSDQEIDEGLQRDLEEDTEERIIPLLHQAESTTLADFEYETNPAREVDREPEF